MATRLYPFAPIGSNRPPISPAFEAGWTETDSAQRVALRNKIPSGASSGFGNSMDGAPNTSQLFLQCISFPMKADIAFLTTDTISGVMNCWENAEEDNIDRVPFCLKVVSADGNTVQAILKALGYYGVLTSELPVAVNNTRVIADNVFLGANYTTVFGDRLVFEVGLQVSAAGGTTPGGSLNILGDSDRSDYPKVDSLQDFRNPWIQLSTDVTFLVPSEESLVISTPVWANKHRIMA